jgi:WD40 repeat protein
MQHLAASYSDSTIHIWYEDTDAITLSTEAGSLNTLAYTPDGQMLAVAADWSRVIFWNPLDGSLLKIIYDHTSVVSDLAFSPDGHLLVTVSHDGTIRIYGVP